MVENLNLQVFGVFFPKKFREKIGLLDLVGTGCRAALHASATEPRDDAIRTQDQTHRHPHLALARAHGTRLLAAGGSRVAPATSHSRFACASPNRNAPVRAARAPLVIGRCKYYKYYDYTN